MHLWHASMQDLALPGKSPTFQRIICAPINACMIAFAAVSPIGTLQALRIKGSITPTVEKDMQISFDEAFRIVHDYANQGDAYCQYVIGKCLFLA